MYLVELGRTENFSFLSLSESKGVGCVKDFRPVVVLYNSVECKDVKFNLELIIGLDKVNNLKMHLIGYTDKLFFDKSQLMENPIELFNILKKEYDSILNSQNVLTLMGEIQNLVNEAIIVWFEINNGFLYWKIRFVI